MPTSYPGGLDAFTNPTAADTLDSPPHDVQHADANDAVEAIEAELGTDPSGTFPTVRDRVEGVEAALSGLVLDDIADVAAPAPTDGQVLTWDTGTALWRPETPGGGGGGGAGFVELANAANREGTPALVREFSDAEPSDWTVVEDVSPNVTVTKKLDKLSVYHPGGDATAEMHGIVWPFAPAGSFYLEAGWRAMFANTNYFIAGLVAANGATYGAGAQRWVSTTWSSAPNFDLRDMTNWNAQAAVSSGGGVITSFDPNVVMPVLYGRLTYNAATGEWQSFISPDGVSWLLVTTRTSALTVTHVGFALSTWGGVQAAVLSLEYFAAYDGLP